jgi:hypothetical protein
MNGGAARAFFSFGGPPPDVHSVTGWKRLYAALLASCALHAALVLAPYHGTGTDADTAASRSAARMPDAGAARVLDVRLQRASAAPAAAAARPAAPSPARGSERLPVPAPAYYYTDQLTKPPRALSQPRLEVPRKVARSVVGKVQLKLWINELGGVESVEVEASDLPNTVSEVAAAAFRELRFAPGEIDGVRVRTLMRVEVAYSGGRVSAP